MLESGRAQGKEERAPMLPGKWGWRREIGTLALVTGCDHLPKCCPSVIWETLAIWETWVEGGHRCEKRPAT